MDRTTTIYLTISPVFSSLDDIDGLIEGLRTLKDQAHGLSARGFAIEFERIDADHVEFTATRELTRDQAISFRNMYAPGRVLDWGGELIGADV